ncbi:hypothetical protein PAAG_02335 [Paracoccidioides lutzii Pb01]|uniref:Uncharacterized protein n=1 Tax=Paracoccidioides lutzii (strain ATCC MYA-826 / Pb01) TaxID=502779 RepID=C1GUL2_PARBA|nr:hypothetical protein PAAG_02335 [Paracoccidioides lutzii Pb01]EEH40280.2 hypothetical protein PAAG_02335 [Paracoccidioides lutzii Pb01]
MQKPGGGGEGPDASATTVIFLLSNSPRQPVVEMRRDLRIAPAPQTLKSPGDTGIETGPPTVERGLKAAFAHSFKTVTSLQSLLRTEYSAHS